MQILGMLLMFVGGVAVVGTSLWMLVLAFQESLGWGLAYIFIPFAALVFLIQHWDKAKQPFLLSLLAVVVFMAGGMMAGTGLGGAGAGAGF